jgi:deoxyribonuclease IV
MIGRHLNIGHGLLYTPKEAVAHGYQLYQVFLSVPHQVISKARPVADLIKLGTELESHQLSMVIHGSYTINLCHPPNTLKANNSIKSLVQDLTAAGHIGPQCLGVIIHMGKNIPDNKISRQQAINNYCMGLQVALELVMTENSQSITRPIILETGAGQGNEVGTDLETLSEIYHSVNTVYKPYIKFCIDTCHIWAAGYDISDANKVNAYFDKFDALIGIDQIVCIHFNNSKTDCGSKVDRHADLDYGLIPTAGLKAIALFALSHDIPLITETPIDSVNPRTNRDITIDDELKLIKKWLRT